VTARRFPSRWPSPTDEAPVRPRRQPIAKTCERCGSPFLATGPGANWERKRFCSRRCQNAAREQRRDRAYKHEHAHLWWVREKARRDMEKEQAA